MIKGILFDLDNTLIDFMKMKDQCTRASIDAMLKAGLNMSYKEAYDGLFKVYEEHGIENPKFFQEFLKKATNKIDYKILSAGIIAYRKIKTGQLIPYPNVEETLKKLKKNNIKLGIVSDAPKLKAWLRLTAMNLVDYFDIILGYEDTGKLKPSAEPFKKALKKLELEPEEVLFVGDNPQRDILGAKKVGMKTVLAEYGQIFEGKNADYKIKNIKELLKITKKINENTQK